MTVRGNVVVVGSATDEGPVVGRQCVEESERTTCTTYMSKLGNISIRVVLWDVLQDYRLTRHRYNASSAHECGELWPC